MNARSNLVADRDLYLTSDQSGIVGEGEGAAYLLARKGMRIRAEWVRRLGLVERNGKVVQGASGQEDDASPTEPEEQPAPSDCEEDAAEEWPLSMSPEEYLDRYDEGAKNYALAKRLAGE